MTNVVSETHAHFHGIDKGPTKGRENVEEEKRASKVVNRGVRCKNRAKRNLDSWGKMG